MQAAQHPEYPPTLGARFSGDGKCRFLVWAPKVEAVDLHIVAPRKRLLEMQARERGYFQLVAEDIEPDKRYSYRLDGKHDRSDPASRFQPDGVHHTSQVAPADFARQDDRHRKLRYSR